MTYEPRAFRPPFRRGDFHLVDTARAGTYWQSPDGIVVRMASAAGNGIDAGECSADGDAVEGRAFRQRPIV
jgi:hypothetical protein